MVQATAGNKRTTEHVKLTAIAYRALGRAFSAEPADAAAALGELAACLDALDWHDAAAEARRADEAFASAPDAARTQHSRIFHRSLPPPYETTHTSGGSVRELADIAGFYGAFGMAASGEKADHVAVEMEFMSYLALKEVHARGQSHAEREDVTREARGRFITAHAGTWLPLLAAQIERVSPDGPYATIVRAAHLAITADAADLGIAMPPVAVYASNPDAMPGPAASPDRPYCGADEEEWDDEGMGDAGS